MRLYYQILFWTVLSTRVFAQKITSTQLTAEFLKGRLIVFNGFALHTADSSFFEKIVEGEIIKVEHLDSIVGLTEYGSVGKNGVVRVRINRLNKLKKERYTVVDASILKYFNEEKKIFYFIDGLPNTDIYYSIDGLVNKKIKEIKELGSPQAEAIWGSQGKNGAVIINTDGKIDLPMK